LGLFEINEAARLVADAAHPDANIIFGAVIDDTLGDEVRVTVIAAGFDGGEPPAKRAGRQVADHSGTGEIPTFARNVQQPKTVVFEEADDELDVPDFLK
jgi:cell division protein FtsZ